MKKMQKPSEAIFSRVNKSRTTKQRNAKMKLDVQEELKKIMTSGMTTGQILRALTELRAKIAKQKRAEQKRKFDRSK